MPRSSAVRRAALSALAAAFLATAASCSKERAADADKGGPEADRLGKAIDESTEAIRLDPKGIDARGELARARRARAYAERGEGEKAIADYAEAIRLYPEIRTPYHSARLQEAHLARAEAYFKRGEHDGAIADYTAVVQSGGQSFGTMAEALGGGGLVARALHRRGACYESKGDRDRAADDYAEAARLAPELLNDEDFKRRIGK